MKKTLTLFCLFVFVASSHAQQKLEIISTDITLFWRAFDKLQLAKTKADSVLILDQEYIQKGSPGVKQFMVGRIQNGEYLQKIITTHKGYYTSLRQHTSKLDDLLPKLKKHYNRLVKLYPETDIPKIYFVIGSLNSAGTIQQDPVVGVDMFGFYPSTPKNELSPWLNSVLRPIEEIDVVTVHEMVHILQKGHAEIENTLLKKSISEGGADFVGELVTKSNINKHIHAFGNEHEQELWLEFKQAMHDTDISKWLYNGLTNRDRPADLGYYIGYKICEAYYKKAKNKKQAIKEILDISDYDAFLAQSGYAQKFMN